MAKLALGSAQSIVDCTDGTIGSVCDRNILGAAIKWLWDEPKLDTFTSDECSTTVFANGFGIVLKDSKMQAHPDGEVCTATAVNHTPVLSTYSGTVYVQGKQVGRVGDKYNKDTTFDHTISKCDVSTVYAG
jgi:uncharacterized Zn-binding protein involved in type VI secretion